MSPGATGRAVVLDRDGTLIVERGYLSEPRDVELIKGAAAGLRRLRQLGLRLVVATNQSGIGRGYFDETRLAAIHGRLRDLLDEADVALDGIYACPHTPEDGCGCRKPAPGLVHRAAGELNFDPRRAFVVGDKACDIELGRRIGAVTFLVRTGYGGQVAAEGRVTPDHVVDGLVEAAERIAALVSREEVAADERATV